MAKLKIKPLSQFSNVALRKSIKRINIRPKHSPRAVWTARTRKAARRQPVPVHNLGEAVCEVVYLKEAQANFVRPQVSPLSAVRGLIERGHRSCQRRGQLVRVHVSPVNFDLLTYT